MRTYHTAILAALLPALLQAQNKPDSEPFFLAPPGIDTQLEKYRDLDPAGFLQIRGFASDHQGFLWCWTNEGIARFDGYDAKLYREDLADTAGKFKTGLVAIAVDGEGSIWAATPLGGLKRLDPVTGQSRWYRGRRDDSTAIGTGATKLLVTSDGELWAAWRFGLARYKRESDSFIRYNLPADPSIGRNFPIISLCELDRSIWVALAGSVSEEGAGLAEFNRDTGVWKMYTHEKLTGSSPSDNIVKAVCADRTGRLWIGTRISLDRYDPRTGTWDHYSVSKDGISTSMNHTDLRPSVSVRAIVEDGFGGIWLATEGAGIFRFDPATGASACYRHNENDVNSIPYDFVFWLNSPRHGEHRESASVHSQLASSIIWIPWGFEGAHRVIIRENPCTSVLISTKEGAVRPPVVCTLWPDSPGKTWAGIYNGGIGLFDLKTRMVRWYPGPERIWRLFRLRDNTLLASTQLFRTWILDERRNTFAPFCPDLEIQCFLEENDSILWLGGSNVMGMSHIASLDRQTGRYIIYPRQDADSASHRDDIVVRMCKDGRDGLWYGTFGGGLIRFDLKQKTYRRYAGKPGSHDALIANHIAALVPDSAGRLWVGTHTGLDLMDCDRGTFKHMRSLHPNSELYIRDMVDDGEGHLWIAAHQGTFCFTKTTQTFRFLTPPDQFRTTTFWSAMFDPLARTVTFGGGNGFFSFPIDDPPADSDPPPVVFTSFKVFEKPYPLDAEVWSLKSITLPSSASFFSFTFAALDFVNSAKNQYAYQLEGVDPDWVQAGSRRYVSYTNLDAGKYVLRVRGSNSEGIWNEAGTAIEIVILPPWYRTVWAYVAYFIAFGALLYLMRRYDQKHTALKHSLEMKSFEAAKMQEVDQMKSRFFANISHEFRTPLTLILGPVEQLARRFKHDEQTQSTLSTMRRHGHRLLQLINQLLDLSRMDAGKMTIQVRPLELVALSRSLVMSFLSLADCKKIQLIFDPEEDEIVAYADRDKFEKVLTNLLSNAFKFTGEEGEIKVVMRIVHGDKRDQVSTTRGRRVELVVSDTGIGIDEAHIGKVFDRFFQVDSSHTSEQGGTGIGLALTKELVEILRGEITVESSLGRGSTFVVRLPIEKEAWRPEEIAAEDKTPDSYASDAATALLAEGQQPDEQETVREPGKPVVLIVEDNADVRSYVRGILEKQYTIEDAENGKAGLEKARDMEIDLVVSDIMMPVMDGVELCRQLKADDRTSHIPVILLTARATIEGKLEGLETGADDYVVKPFDARELMARVKNLIETRGKLREKYRHRITLGPSDVTVTSTDERFLKRLAEHIEEHVSEAEYDTERLAHDMCMSRMQLHRKLHALTGHSTHELLRQYRLQRAAQLLQKHAGNVSEVAFESGFISLSHFTRAFREQFGVLPSEYKRNGIEKPDRPTPGHA